MPGDVAVTLGKVASELLNEVDAELEAGCKEGLDHVKVVLQQTKADAAKILENGDRQADLLRRKILGAAELQSRNDILLALEDASNEVFREALEEISKSSARYEKSLEMLLAEGASVIGSDAIVECNSRDRDSVNRIIKTMNHENGTNLTLGESRITTIGGVVLYSRDRNTRFDDTLETRLDRMRPQLRSDVVNLLSEGDNPPR